MRETIDAALKDALKTQDKRRISTLRLIRAAIQDRDIIHRGAGKDPVTDEEIMQILSKMVKQREESAKAFEDGGRAELAAQERGEIAIIRDFMPKQLGDTDTLPGESGKMARILDEGFKQRAGETVLIQSTALTASSREFRAAIDDVAHRLSGVGVVTEIKSPLEPGNRSQISADGDMPGMVMLHMVPFMAALHTTAPRPWHTPTPLSVHGSPRVGKASSLSPSQSLSSPSQSVSGMMSPIMSTDTVAG